MTTYEDCLVIGARTLVGRRLREVAPEAAFTSRQPVSGRSLYLDMADPEAFAPDVEFRHVIITAPVWLITERLLLRLKALGMRRLVVFSSTSLLTKDESNEMAEREVVARLRQGEQTVMTVCTAHDVAWTILRPTLIYDEGHDDNISRIRSTIERLGFFPILPPASGLRQPVHARDLARAAVQAMSSPVAEGRSYNLSGGDLHMTYAQMVGRVAQAIGRKSAVLPVPLWAWRLGFAVLRMVRPRAALKQNLAMAQRMNADLWFDYTEATRDFGYAPGVFAPKF